MAFDSTDAVLLSLQSQLAACAGWSGGSSVIHCPEIPWTSATLPCAVVAESQQSSDTYAAGASGLRSGALQVLIYTASDITTTEALGRTILQQLLAQASGIAFRGGSVGLCGEETAAEVAAGTKVFGVELTLEYGLQA